MSCTTLPSRRVSRASQGPPPQRAVGQAGVVVVSQKPRHLPYVPTGTSRVSLAFEQNIDSLSAGAPRLLGRPPPNVLCPCGVGKDQVSGRSQSLGLLSLRASCTRSAYCGCRGFCRQQVVWVVDQAPSGPSRSRVLVSRIPESPTGYGMLDQSLTSQGHSLPISPSDVRSVFLSN